MLRIVPVAALFIALGCQDVERPLGPRQPIEFARTGPGPSDQIAFESDRDGAIQLYVMNADGNGVVRLTNNAAFDGEPAWSPDGLKIAFNSTRAGNEDIYVINADGTNELQLTDDPAYDYTPAWSPDGGRIAFTSNRPDPNGLSTGIFVMRADGSRVSKLSSVMADTEPSWRW